MSGKLIRDEGRSRGLRKSLTGLSVAAAMLFSAAGANAFPVVVDGVPGEWCSPALPLPPDVQLFFPCPPDGELAWSDAPGDEVGYLTGSAPPLGPFFPDPEIDLQLFSVTDDCAGLSFLALHGPFNGLNTPPMMEIAVDFMIPGGAVNWYDPNGAMGFGPLVGPGAGFDWELMIVVDFALPGAWVHRPGFPGPPLGPFPVAWAPNPLGPSVTELQIPWPGLGFAAAPPMGTPFGFAVMTAHSAPDPLFPFSPTGAPATDPDDVITLGGPPPPPTTFQEYMFDFSTDFQLPYNTVGCILAPPTATPTPPASPSPTSSPTSTASPSAAPSPTPTSTPLVPPSPSPNPSATPTPPPMPCFIDPLGDTIGYAVGGGWGIPPYPPLPALDPEVDIRRFCVTDDCNFLTFTIQLAGFPATIGNPPTIQVAMDVVGVVTPPGNVWYDPLGAMIGGATGVGLFAGFDYEHLFVVDTVTGVVGLQSPMLGVGFPGPVPIGPAAFAPGFPATVTFQVPWGAIGVLFPPPQGVQYQFAAMSAHSGFDPNTGFAGMAPVSDPDDVLSLVPTLPEIVPDLSTDFATAYISSGCPPATATPSPNPTSTPAATPSANPTSTPTGTASPSPAPSASPDPSPTASPNPSSSPNPTPTPPPPGPSPTDTPNPTPTPSPLASPSPGATATASVSASATPTPTQSATPTPSATATPSANPSSTPAPTPTPIPATCFNDLINDTIGYGIGGGWGVPPYPPLPLPDPEVDILRFCVSDNCSRLRFTLDLGGFPATIGILPTIQIAMDIIGVNTPAGNVWYDPLGAMIGGANGVGLLGGFNYEHLFIVDLGAGVVMLQSPLLGIGLPVPVPVGPVAFVPGAPALVTIQVPWNMIGIPPPPPQGVAYGFSVMTAHSGFDPLTGQANSAPLNDPDDVLSPVTTQAEIVLDGSTDFQLLHVANGCPPATPTPTPSPLATTTPTATATPSPAPSATPAPTGTPSPAPTSSPNATATPSPNATVTPSPNATATPTPVCCMGDANNSGSFVDAADFISVQANFGSNQPVGGPGDANCSGSFIDAADFIAVQANFGAPC